MDALVAAWLPGSEGQGVADVLFGDYGFTGKLARTWFKRLDQLPMNYGDPNYDPLLPFSFELETNPSTQHNKQHELQLRLIFRTSKKPVYLLLMLRRLCQP